MKKKRHRGTGLFDPVSLADSVNKEICSINLPGNLKCAQTEKKFLGHFTCDDILSLMKRVGLLKHFSKLGFNDLAIIIDQDKSSVHHLRVYHKTVKPENLLIDLRQSKTKFLPPRELIYTEYDRLPYDMIVIEWLAAQNPDASFSSGKPQLPGQSKPGLGVLDYCFDMMYKVAKIVSKDGFLDVPDHGHGAIMYSKKFRFFDPAHEGVLRAILRDLKKYSLSDISWGMITETIIDAQKDRPHVYAPSEQIYCISDRLKKHFKSREYENVLKEYRKKKRFYFDYTAMVAKREQILTRKKIADL